MNAQGNLGKLDLIIEGTRLGNLISKLERDLRVEIEFGTYRSASATCTELSKACLEFARVKDLRDAEARQMEMERLCGEIASGSQMLLAVR